MNAQHNELLKLTNSYLQAKNDAENIGYDEKTRNIAKTFASDQLRRIKNICKKQQLLTLTNIYHDL